MAVSHRPVVTAAAIEIEMSSNMATATVAATVFTGKRDNIIRSNYLRSTVETIILYCCYGLIGMQTVRP